MNDIHIHRVDNGWMIAPEELRFASRKSGLAGTLGGANEIPVTFPVFVAETQEALLARVKELTT